MRKHETSKTSVLSGSYDDNLNYRGRPGEITVDTDHFRLIVHDGERYGGHPQANHDMIIALYTDMSNQLKTLKEMVNCAYDRITELETQQKAHQDHQFDASLKQVREHLHE